MKIIGKMDIEKYKCVTENIVTDEVIITDERIEHIMRNHPGDYERFGHCIHVILREPDYIIEDANPDMAILLKEIKEALNKSPGASRRHIFRLFSPQNLEIHKVFLRFWVFNSQNICSPSCPVDLISASLKKMQGASA